MAINENGVQVERQYIGARYVPKFFEGSGGSPEWVAGIAYEALTIVTYLGNSFTSKIPVPAGIGNPANNPTYWVNTGNYNAQVDEYRNITQQVKENLEKEITDRENQGAELQQQITANSLAINKLAIKEITSESRIIFVTDSYGNYPSPEDNWITRLTRKLGVTNYINITMGSTGFITTPSWQTLLQNKDVESPETITHIIVGGGANDANGTNENTITNAGRNFISYAKQRFPNAQIIIAPFGYGYGIEAINYAYMVNAYRKMCNFPNTHYVDNIYNVLHNINLLLPTNVHPNSAGVDEIVNKMCEWLLSGSCDILYKRYGLPWNEPFGSSTAAVITEILHNGNWMCAINELYIDTPLTIKIGRTQLTKINDYPFQFGLGNTTKTFGVNGMVKLTTEPTQIPAQIWGARGLCYFSFGFSASTSTVTSTLDFGMLKGECLTIIS